MEKGIYIFNRPIKIKEYSLVGGCALTEVGQLALDKNDTKVEVLPPVLSKGFPRETDFQALDALATIIDQKHRENGFTD